MSHLFTLPWNKSKGRTEWPKKFNLGEFPVPGDYSFVQNMTRFLQSEVEECRIRNNRVFCLLLLDKETKIMFPLYLVEQDLTKPNEETAEEEEELGLSGHCIGAGWGGNFTSRMRYHFVIPSSLQCDQPLIVDCVVNAKYSCFHGLIHSNGYGHLVKVVETEGLTKTKILDLWDNICSHFKARFILVVDVYKLRSLVDGGFSFYGHRGYKFERSSYNYPQDKVDVARKRLSSTLLSVIPSRSSIDEFLRVSGTITELERVSDLMACMFNTSSSSSSIKEDFHPSVIGVYEDLLSFEPTQEDDFRVFLNSKHYLVKSIQTSEQPEFLNFWCGFNLIPDMNWPSPAADEYLRLHVGSTVGDLKDLASATLKAMYYVVVHLGEIDHVWENIADDTIIGAKIPEEIPKLLMFGVDRLEDGVLVYEGGAANWTVSCEGCGLHEDDGELMISCEKCRKWQHVSSLGLLGIPESFLCSHCSI